MIGNLKFLLALAIMSGDSLRVDPEEYLGSKWSFHLRRTEAKFWPFGAIFLPSLKLGHGRVQKEGEVRKM